jgi:hypothetical protein
MKSSSHQVNASYTYNYKQLVPRVIRINYSYINHQHCITCFELRNKGCSYPAHYVNFLLHNLCVSEPEQVQTPLTRCKHCHLATEAQRLTSIHRHIFGWFIHHINETYEEFFKTTKTGTLASTTRIHAPGPAKLRDGRSLYNWETRYCNGFK